MNNFYCNCHHFDWSLLWTALTAIGTIGLSVIAYYQLTKLRETNTIQLLVHIESEWNSSDMRKKRRTLAEKLKTALKDVEENKQIDYDELDNSVQDVFDYIEKLAFLTNDGSFELKWLYKLYSYLIQNYWETCIKVGYIYHIRQSLNGGDFYQDYEILYNNLRNAYRMEPASIDELQSFLDEETKFRIYEDK